VLQVVEVERREVGCVRRCELLLQRHCIERSVRREDGRIRGRLAAVVLAGHLERVGIVVHGEWEPVLDLVESLEDASSLALHSGAKSLLEIQTMGLMDSREGVISRERTQ
jgi:hypothetical protein